MQVLNCTLETTAATPDKANSSAKFSLYSPMIPVWLDQANNWRLSGSAG